MSGEIVAEKRRRADAQAKAMYEDYLSGMTMKQVAEKFNRKQQSVSELFITRGWPARKRGDEYKGLPAKDVRRAQIGPDRFWSKVSVEGDGSYEQCWIWTAYVSPAGYGTFSVGGRASGRSFAHRVAYELMVAEIPAGLQLDHLCRRPACVNPWHLEPVTALVNSQRSSCGSVNRERLALITHCPQGHEYSEENTKRKPTKYGGWARHCRQCQRDYAKRVRLERKAAGVL